MPRRILDMHGKVWNNACKRDLIRPEPYRKTTHEKQEAESMKEQYSLRCGAARADITPPVGTILYGYAPGRPAESVGDPLTLTAVKVAYGEESALLITCSVASLNDELCLRMRKAAGEAAGVPARNVTINATHTHSAPNCSIRSGWGEVDTAYIEGILVPGCVKAAREAAETLRPALFGIGEVESDVGVNRRELKEDGSIVLGQNPWGIHDPRMTVISFKDPDGRIIANLIHYGCHGTASGCNPEITRDWPGVMTDMLDAETGGISGFYAGFEGDQGPNLPNGKTTGNYRLALQHGARAGEDAVRAFRSIREWRNAPVQVLHGTIRSPFDPLAPREKAEEELTRIGTLEQICAEKRFSDVNAYIHWHKVLEEYESGRPLRTEWTFDQDITVIGPAAILPAPFEAFAEIGLRLRRHSPFGYTLNLCNTHGALAYLPALGDIGRGGYEVWHFLLAMRTTYPLPHNTDDYWVRQNLAILRSAAAPSE